MEPYALKKATWTDDDLDQLNLYGSTVHAFAILNNRSGETGDLALDIDYLLDPLNSIDEERLWWVADATLLFRDVCIASINTILGDRADFGWTIAGFSKLGPGICTEDEDHFKYHLELEYGHVLLEAASFRLVIKRKPRLGDRLKNHRANFGIRPVKFG